MHWIFEGEKEEVCLKKWRDDDGEYKKSHQGSNHGYLCRVGSLLPTKKEFTTKSQGHCDHEFHDVLEESSWHSMGIES